MAVGCADEEEAGPSISGSPSTSLSAFYLWGGAVAMGGPPVPMERQRLWTKSGWLHPSPSFSFLRSLVPLHLPSQPQPPSEARRQVREVPPMADGGESISTAASLFASGCVHPWTSAPPLSGFVVVPLSELVSATTSTSPILSCAMAVMTVGWNPVGPYSFHSLFPLGLGFDFFRFQIVHLWTDPH